MSEHEVEFSGGVFHPGLPDGRAGASITLLSDRAQVACEGGKAFALPYEGLRVELGGASGRMAFLRGKIDQLTVYSEAPGFLQALRRESGGRLDESIDALIGKRSAVRISTWTWVAGGVVVTVLLGWGLWIGAGIATRAAIHRVPLTVDRQLGDAAGREASMGPVVADTQLTTAITGMVDRLKPFAVVDGPAGEAPAEPAGKGLEWRVSVQQVDQINAFALPGGSITVLTGLIARAERADQVAAVVAHEMAHATKRHGLRQVAGQIGVFAGVQILLGDASGVIGLAAQGATMALLTGYSRDMEREADAEGVRMMAAAGLDPSAAIEFFAIMQKETGDSEALAWMSSHPSHRERIAALEALIPGLPRGEAKPLALDWMAIRVAAGYKAAK